MHWGASQPSQKDLLRLDSKKKLLKAEVASLKREVASQKACLHTLAKQIQKVGRGMLMNLAAGSAVLQRRRSHSSAARCQKTDGLSRLLTHTLTKLFIQADLALPISVFLALQGSVTLERSSPSSACASPWRVDELADMVRVPGPDCRPRPG